MVMMSLMIVMMVMPLENENIVMMTIPMMEGDEQHSSK